MTSTVPGRVWRPLPLTRLAVFKLLGRLKGRFVGHIAFQHIENEFSSMAWRMVYRWKACGGLSLEAGWLGSVGRPNSIKVVLRRTGKGEIADIVRASRDFLQLFQQFIPPSWWTSCLPSSPARACSLAAVEPVCELRASINDHSKVFQGMVS